MTKEEALQDFLSSFKAALNNSAIYFPGHPILNKSVEDLQKGISGLFHFINPIKIGFTSESLFIDGKVWEKTRLYEELAVFFHFRKIKSLEIRNSAASEDLARFLIKVSLPAKTLFREGGMEFILKKEQISGILTEDLDYYQLLNAEGQEYKEIWVYLFRDIIDKKDREKISQFIDNFPTIVSKFKSEDLLENEDLKENILKLLEYLKNNEADKFKKCTQEIAKVMLRGRNSFSESRLKKVRAFFKDVTADEFADILWQEAAEDDNFDSVALDLFSCFVGDNKQHDKIASSLQEKARKTQPFLKSRQLAGKLKALFLSSGKEAISQVYINSLSSLLNSAPPKEKEARAIDRDALRANYRLMALNLLAQETNKARLALISRKLSEEWDGLVKDKDAQSLRKFLEIYEKKKTDLAFTEVSEPFKKRILGFIENSVLEENIPEGFECFVDMLSESMLTVKVYIDKIFKGRKVNPSILKLFFKFFPADLALFYHSLKKVSLDIEFINSMVASLKAVNSRLSLEMLKYIYSFPGSLVKIEVLKAMREMTKRDEEFLLSLLKGIEIALKKEALAALLVDPKALKGALEALLCSPSPFGIRNKILEENIEIINEANVLFYAREYLSVLSQRRFFWNRGLRRNAQGALKKGHD